jgi:hypothetical protein
VNELLGALILSASISASNAGADDAVKALAKASYKQMNLDEQLKRLEKKHVPKVVKHYGTYSIILARVIVENKISYEWRF